MQTYSHSGTVPVRAAISTILVGMAVAAIGGIVYAYAFYWIPFVYLNFLITLAYGCAIGIALSITAKRGRIRNNLFVRIVAIFVALLGLYVYWAAYLWALAGVGNIGLRAFSPAVLVAFAEHLFQKGSWGIKAVTITGWPLVGFWMVEAIIVLRVAMSAALAESRRPYCESCDNWTEVEEDVARLAATGQEPAWQRVFAGDLPSLAEFPAAEPEAQQFVRLGTARCPQCEQSRFLTASAVQIKIDKKGKKTEKERRLITNAMLTPAQYAVVDACSKLYRREPVEGMTGEIGQSTQPPDPVSLSSPVEPASGEASKI